MADERLCFAGDLGTGHLMKMVRVEVPGDDDVAGVLVGVSHNISVLTAKPITVVSVDAPLPHSDDLRPKVYVLDEHWKVTVP